MALRIGAALSALLPGGVHRDAPDGDESADLGPDDLALAALFLASAASTGVASMILLVRWRLRETSEEVIEKLDRVDALAMGLELILMAAFALSLGKFAAPAFLRWPGILVPTFVLPVGLVLPLALRKIPGRWTRWGLPIMVLLAGYALRFAVVGMPGPMLLGGLGAP